MSKVQIFHNPRCSKSRQTLELLRQHGVEPAIRLYLEEGPSEVELQQLLQKLGMQDPRDLMRSKEALYKELGLSDDDIDQQDLLRAMVSHPKLIERPIVVNGERAAIGRPPENVLAIL